MSTPPADDARVPAWLDRQAAIAGRLLVLGLAISAAIWLALQVRFISMAVVLGFAEVSLLWPAVKWLRARRVPQAIAAILCVVGFLAVFIGLLAFVVSEVVQSSPRLADAVSGAFTDILGWIRSGPFGVDTDAVQDVLDELQSSVGDYVGNLGAGVATGLSVVGNVLTVLLIATFFAIFALSSGDRLWAQFASTLTVDRRRPATAAFQASMKAAGNWFYASTVTGIVDGFLIGLGLTILDVPLAVPIGALTFVLAYIPLVGATIAGRGRGPGRAVHRRMGDGPVDAGDRARGPAVGGQRPLAAAAVAGIELPSADHAAADHRGGFGLWLGRAVPGDPGDRRDHRGGDDLPPGPG